MSADAHRPGRGPLPADARLRDGRDADPRDRHLQRLLGAVDGRWAAEGGHIDTCELSEQHAEVARRYIAQSPHADRITVHLGPAIETIARLDGPFDLVFVDADKPGYDAYYEAVLPKLAPRGLIVFDNMLQNGASSRSRSGEATKAIVALNEKLVADERVVCVLLTVRDGVTLVRKAD